MYFESSSLSISLCISSRLIGRVAIDIPEGEKLYTVYTYTLNGTSTRQAALKSSKYFTCRCPRCLDPTELGTHFSSLKCQKCDNGLIVSSNPLGKIYIDFFRNRTLKPVLLYFPLQMTRRSGDAQTVSSKQGELPCRKLFRLCKPK